MFNNCHGGSSVKNALRLRELIEELPLKGTSKNVIPEKMEIHNVLKLLNSLLRGRDRLEIIRGSLN
jgi:hypothetical protein